MTNAINSGNIYISSNEINELIKEFDKSKNVIGMIPGIGDLLRAEIVKDGKKHFYFNMAGFFDPEKGFIKTLGDIYSRYLEIKNIKKEDVIPFHCLMMKPFEKIVEYLDIAKGSLLYKSLGYIYSFLYGAGIGVLCGILYSINPIAGAIGTGVALIGMGYELYKGNRHYKYKEYLENQGNLFISKISGLFEKDYNTYILECNCNIIEIIVDESFNSIIEGIFNFSEKQSQSVIINYWRIPQIQKAKGIKDYPESKRKMYSFIVEKLRDLKTDKSFFELYKQLHMNYHQTYKDAKEFEKKSNKFDEIKAIKDKIVYYRRIDKNHPEIDRLNKELLELI